MDESIQNALLRCVFRVFTVSHDPASYTGDLFHMTFAKLSEGSSSPTFGGCDQLFLTPPSKIANRCGITLRRRKSHRYGKPPPSNQGRHFVAPSISFPLHPPADGPRTGLQPHPVR